LYIFGFRCSCIECQCCGHVGHALY
jgi:hypothetical protein